ncbi:MAG: EamA family transporter [Verrucomicrobiota bacterium]|nr:EamA family transporter [Verrucomicrobiota bacterium]
MNWLHWSLLSAFFAALTAVLSKIGVEGVNSNLATAARTFFVFLFAAVIASMTSTPSALLQFSKRTWIILIASALATALSWICYFRALQLGEVSRVSPVDKLSVVFAMLLAAWVLREQLTLQHFLGGIFIVIGAMMLAWKSI